MIRSSVPFYIPIPSHPKDRWVVCGCHIERPRRDKRAIPLIMFAKTMALNEHDNILAILFWPFFAPVSSILTPQRCLILHSFRCSSSLSLILWSLLFVLNVSALVPVSDSALLAGHWSDPSREQHRVSRDARTMSITRETDAPSSFLLLLLFVVV